MAEHTPTPWMLRKNPDTGDIHILAPSAFYDGRPVMVTSVGTVLEEARDANAEHIVLCVNAHDDLYERFFMTAEGFHIIHTRESGGDPSLIHLDECELTTCRLNWAVLAPIALTKAVPS